jgi:ketosteroid isomerase-like protein
MKLTAIAASVFVFVLTYANQAQTPTQAKKGGVEQELIQLEDEWGDAFLKRDVAFMDRIMADDATWTSPEGIVSTKAQYLASFKSLEGVDTSWVNDEMKVRVYGDTAVVTGRTTFKWTNKGKDFSGQERWTDTWVKLAGHWGFVAGHNSKIVNK